MSRTFLRSQRALNADGFRSSKVGVPIAALLLGGWLAWFLFARVTVYEISDTARLEVVQSVFPIAAPVDGVIVSNHLSLGDSVRQGDLLVELDANAQTLQREEESARLAGLTPQLRFLEEQIDAEERALDETRKGAAVTLEEARAELREAEATARLAKQEAERLKTLHAKGQIAEMEVLRAEAEVDRSQAAADAVALRIDRLGQDLKNDESERTVRIARLRGESSRIDGETATIAATIARLDYEIEKRYLRAPATGRIEDRVNVEAGAFVSEGDQLGAIVVPGRLRVVGDFFVSGSLGRLRPGQRARVRLDGFPWTQYGSVPATVSNIASEARDKRIRVELAVDAERESTIPLQHGLTGSVQVEVERVPPVALVLRALGRVLNSHGTPAEAGGGAP